ncbi:MAG TPA: hypothetical protein VGR76_05610, partial [Candidatus Angelobacter sp.]|nr:hypothetical protein [Candidatus Angelobacter sp.]
MALVEEIRKSQADEQRAKAASEFPPLSDIAQALERRFTLQDAPPEPKPDIAPAPDIDKVLAALGEPTTVTPEGTTYFPDYGRAPEAKSEFASIKPEEQNAIQEPKTGEILPREQEQAGSAGGQRTGVGSGEQGIATADESAQSERKPPIQTTPDDGTVEQTGVHNEAFAQRFGEDAPEPGTGHNWEQIARQGEADVASGRIDPYEVASRANAGKIIEPTELGALRAEYARSHAEAAAAEEAGLPDAKEKADASLDLANAFQRAKGPYSEGMRGMQGMEDIKDPSTVVGLREMMQREIGRDAEEPELPHLNRVAEDVRTADRTAGAATEDAFAKAEMRMRRVPDMAFED